MKIEKFKVCASCFSLGIKYIDCICTYSDDYPEVELEFEVCECCGRPLDEPADTEFNNSQFEKLGLNDLEI